VSDIKFTKEEIKEFQGSVPDSGNQGTTKKTVPENPLRKNRYGKTVTENQELQNTHTNTHKQKTHKQKSKYVGNGDASAILDLFAQAYKLTGYARQKLMELVEMYGEMLVLEALDRAVASETDRPVAYIRGILQKWSKAGVQTTEDIENYERNFRAEQRKKKERKQPRKQKQPKYEEDELPVAVQLQMEREKARKEQNQPVEQQEEKESEEELAAMRARIKQKLENMRKRLGSKNEPDLVDSP
jgi:DnaD/phage-associated family protein